MVGNDDVRMDVDHEALGFNSLQELADFVTGKIDSS